MGGGVGGGSMGGGGMGGGVGGGGMGEGGGGGMGEGGGGGGGFEGGGGEGGGGGGGDGGGGEGDGGIGGGVGGGGDGETQLLHSRTSWTSWATELISACCASYFAWNSTYFARNSARREVVILSSKAEIASEHPQVGVSDAVTLPSIQKAARYMSRRGRITCGAEHAVIGAR